MRMLVDMIIPADERSGSATDAGVPEFMDYLMNDPTDTDLQRERRQTAMRGGLAWINTVAEHRFGHAFAEATEAERTHDPGRDRLRQGRARGRGGDARAARPPRDRPARPSFFNSFRDLTASGFWSSKMGVDDLRYVGNRFVAEWKDPPAEVLARARPRPRSDRRTSLPRPRCSFLRRAASACARIARLVGLAAGGSYLTGTMDEFSDLDLVVAVEPDGLRRRDARSPAHRRLARTAAGRLHRRARRRAARPHLPVRPAAPARGPEVRALCRTPPTASRTRRSCGSATAA